MTSRVEMIIETLKANSGRQFSARDLAREFLSRYPEEMALKQQNPRYATEDALIAQLAAEIGGERTVTAKQKCPQVSTRDKPRPRLYFWQDTPEMEPSAEDEGEPEMAQAHSEHDLYPLLMGYLQQEHKLYCQRIDEKRSRNSKGSGGNHWLHPDIVAIEPLDRGWNEAVRTCVRHGNYSSARLWSFEVKKDLSIGNVRQCFFQAVSNSSWANLGYLVTTGLRDGVEPELQMLSALHGIGVILLNSEEPYESQILIPARERSSVDWQSVNRIVAENRDFHHYIEQIGIYYQTGKLLDRAWNR
ncbi:COG2958 family protein [Dongshaea marina]|uniref:COG2958 family protein n=1 Tax=Dongshaea marina TaxID=2047966 RepID=UPI000D3E7FF1|nr:HrgA protein [Dongshaea marina]